MWATGVQPPSGREKRGERTRLDQVGEQPRQCVDEVEEKFLDLVYHSPTKWLVFLKLQQVVYQFQECEVNKDEWISCEDQKYSREAYTLLVQSDVERRETIDRRPASTSPMGLTKKIERRSSTIR